jgi:hypothetical protein
MIRKRSRPRVPTRSSGVGIAVAFLLPLLALLLARPAVRFATGGPGAIREPVVPIDLSVVDGSPDTLRLVPGILYRTDQIDLKAVRRIRRTRLAPCVPRCQNIQQPVVRRARLREMA